MIQSKPPRRRGRFGVLVALLVAGATALSSCSIYDVQLPGGPNVGSNPIKVQILFRDVLDLVPQSTVKVDDVSVGKVTKISLKGYVADVTVELPRSVDLPDNALATIRQTSLLGEKFVSLSKPSKPTGRLSTGDVIGLENTGRNPEVEEVFSALALLLNGGGVAQLKTIAEEMNTALGGREPAVRSVITQVRSLMSQLDNNKGAIVNALENVNRLSLEVRRQDGAIKLALDDLPGAVKSINGQRADLVKMLQALSRLSSIGVQVIKASKSTTIDSLRNLSPVLFAFARAGQDFPKSLQVFLTYPFVDEAVGRDPQVARNLHMGDFTNLSARLDLNPFDLPNIPGIPGSPVSVQDLFNTCSTTPLAAVCGILNPTNANPLCGLVMLPVLCAAPGAVPSAKAGSTPKPVAPNAAATPNSSPLGGITGTVPGLGGSGTGGNGTTGGSNSGSSSGSGGLLGGLFAGLGRPATNFDRLASTDPFLLGARGFDPALGTLLLQGVAFK